MSSDPHFLPFKYAVCMVPVAPLRAEAAHRSEMISQLLFGERCEVLSNITDGWVRVRCRYDEYEGWCQLVQLSGVDDDFYGIKNEVYAGDWQNEIYVNGELVHIPLGSALPAFQQKGFEWGNRHLEYRGILWRKSETLRSDVILRGLAFQFLHTAYLWGGKSVFGTDCSGFVQTVMKLMDVSLPRDASQQALKGTGMDFLEEAKCGDLAFFNNEKGKITHVGLLLGNGEIIHSSGEVRVDPIDNHGITSSTTGIRTHTLCALRRVLPAWHFE